MPPDSLKKILIQQGANNLSLPVLKEPPSTVDSLLSDLLHWISGFFPESLPGLGFDAKKFVYAAVLALVAAGILALLFHYAQRRNALSSDAKSVGPSRELPVEILELEMRKAMERGDFAQAARLRWRLFLVRRGFPPCRTPREVFPDSSDWLPHYRLMFCPSADAQGDFERFRQWAEAHEQNEGSA